MPNFPAEVSGFRLVGPARAGDRPNLFVAEGRDGPAAVQFLPEYAEAEPDVRARLDREIDAWTALNHPNVARVLAHGTENRLRYYVLEAVDGNALTAVLDDLRHADQTMPFDRAHSLFKQLCNGLLALHQAGIRHGEISPSLLVVSATQDLKILPPWAVRLNPERSAARERFAALARPSYYAPEVVRSSEAGDARADVYSAGMVMYEMLTGFLPAKVVRRPSVINPTVPPWFEDTLAKLLDADPEVRPPLGSLAATSGPALSEAGLNRISNIVGGAILGAVVGAVFLYYKNGNIWLGALAGAIPGLLAGAFFKPAGAPRQPAYAPLESARFPTGGTKRADPVGGPNDGIIRRD